MKGMFRCLNVQQMSKINAQQNFPFMPNFLGKMLDARNKYGVTQHTKNILHFFFIPESNFRFQGPMWSP